MTSIKFYLILLLVAFTLALDNFLNHDEISIKSNLYLVDEEGQFADLLNGILGTELDKTIMLSHCSNPYTPQPNSHEKFKNDFGQLLYNASTFLKSKLYKQITGELCQYNLQDKNVFISSKSAKITTKSYFSQVLIKSIVGSSMLQFLECVGADELARISDVDYAYELLFMLQKEERLNQLFESFCSVNNSFHFLKDPVDLSNKNLFNIIGKTFKSIFVAVKDHYEFILSKN
jgi:hypothetical protein